MSNKNPGKIGRTGGNRFAPVVFLAPAVILIFTLSVLPMCYSLYISFLKYNISKPAKTIRFYELKNYIKMLTDEVFLSSILWTLEFAVVSVLFELLIGMLVALGLHSNLSKRFSTPMKTVFLMPMMVAAIVASTAWRLMFYPVYGVVNCTLELLGLQAVNWLGDMTSAKIAVIIVEVWCATPFCILVLQAALKTVSIDMLEAASVDGTSPVRRFFSITLPTIRNFVALVLTMRLSDALRAFDVSYSLTNGGPGTATETIATRIYKTAFRYSDVGQGSAGAYLFFIVIAIVSVITFKFMRKQDA